MRTVYTQNWMEDPQRYCEDMYDVLNMLEWMEVMMDFELQPYEEL